MIKDALISDCEKYRYWLSRQWGTRADNNVAFIGLNPSTADASDDDATMRVCINYAKRWGYDGLYMLNLFAYRDTYPQHMMKAADPIGPGNLRHLQTIARECRLQVACWGNFGTHLDQAFKVLQLFPRLHCITITAAGQPGHPLYKKKTLKPQPFTTLERYKNANK